MHCYVLLKAHVLYLEFRVCKGLALPGDPCLAASDVLKRKNIQFSCV